MPPENLGHSLHVSRGQIVVHGESEDFLAERGRPLRRFPGQGRVGVPPERVAVDPFFQESADQCLAFFDSDRQRERDSVVAKTGQERREPLGIFHEGGQSGPMLAPLRDNSCRVPPAQSSLRDPGDTPTVGSVGVG